MTKTSPSNTGKRVSILIAKNGRAALIGKTGTGKTHLAKTLIERHNGAVCVLDPKQLFIESPDEMKRLRIERICSSLFEVKLFRPKRFVFRPLDKDFDNLELYDELYKWCYTRKNILVYTDDMAGIIPKGQNLPYLRRCYTMGRQRGVSMLTAMQRPVTFPPYMFTDSEQFYVFYDPFPDDVKRVQAYVPGFKSAMVDEEYSFVYYDVRHHRMQPVRLMLSKDGNHLQCL